MGVVASTGGSSGSLVKLLDGLITALAVVWAFLLRNDLAPHISSDIYGIQEMSTYLVFIVIAFFLAPIVLAKRGFYKVTLKYSKLEIAGIALESSIILFLVMVLFDFFFKVDASRIVFIIFLPISTAQLYARQLIERILHKRVLQNISQRVNVLILTDRVGMTRCGGKITERPELGYQIVKMVAFGELAVEEFVNTLHEKNVGVVVFEVSPTAVRNVASYVQACEDEGIEVWFAANFIETRLARAEVGYLDDLPIMIFKTTSGHVWQLVGKDIFDRLASAFLILALSPLFIILAIGVKLTSPGPIFFTQRRNGLYGRPFNMFKFRTMYTDAEKRRSDLLGKNEMSGPVFKITDDPRVTPFGAIIRRHALDEIPQLFNVFFGDMSLVGPRPLPTYETQGIEANEQRRRLSVKPGMTCLWQVSGRNDVKGFDEWVKMDLKYIDEWTLFLDFKILILTVPAVLTGRGGR